MKHLRAALFCCLAACLTSCFSHLNPPPDGAALPSRMTGVWDLKSGSSAYPEAQCYVQFVTKNGHETTALLWMSGYGSSPVQDSRKESYILGHMEASCHRIDEDVVLALKLVRAAMPGGSVEKDLNHYRFYLLRSTFAGYETKELSLKMETLPETASPAEIKTALARAIQTLKADAKEFGSGWEPLKPTKLTSLPELPETQAYFAVLREKARAEAAGQTPEEVKRHDVQLRQYEQDYTYLRAVIEAARF